MEINKIFFLSLIMALVISMGCIGSETGESEESGETGQSDNGGSSSQDDGTGSSVGGSNDQSDPCQVLMTDSGGYVYTAEDAEALLGGDWTDEGTTILGNGACQVKINEEDVEDASVTGGTKYGGKILFKEMQSYEYDTHTTGSPGKYVSGIGDEAYIYWWSNEDSYADAKSPTLIFNKGDTYIYITCSKSSDDSHSSHKCSEDELIDIGQTIDSRLS